MLHEIFQVLGKQPTEVFLPGQKNLAGYSLWDHRVRLTLSPFYNFRAILGVAEENTNLNNFKILMLINKGKILNCPLQYWMLASERYSVILL